MLVWASQPIKLSAVHALSPHILQESFDRHLWCPLSVQSLSGLNSTLILQDTDVWGDLDMLPICVFSFGVPCAGYMKRGGGGPMTPVTGEIKSRRAHNFIQKANGEFVPADPGITYKYLYSTPTAVHAAVRRPRVLTTGICRRQQDHDWIRAGEGSVTVSA